MKSVLKFFLALLFVISVPIFVLCLSLRFSNFSGTYLKQTLDEYDTYPKLYTMINNLVDSSLKDNSKDNPLKLLRPFIKKELSAQYFQAKIEQAIDDTEAWVIGRNTATPTVSFTDVKEKLVKQNAKIITQLQTMEKSYTESKPQLETALKEAQKEDPSLTATTLPEVNLSSWLSKEPVIALENYLGWVKPLYFLAHTGTFILGGLLILYAGSIVLLSSPRIGGLKLLTFIFLIAAGWNYLLFMSTNRLIPLLYNYLPTQVKNIDVTTLLPPSLWSPFSQSLVKISPLVSLVLLGLGLVTLMIPMFLQRKTSK